MRESKKASKKEIEERGEEGRKKENHSMQIYICQKEFENLLFVLYFTRSSYILYI